MEPIWAFIAGVLVGEFGLLFALGLCAAARDEATDQSTIKSKEGEQKAHLFCFSEFFNSLLLT